MVLCFKEVAEVNLTLDEPQNSLDLLLVSLTLEAAVWVVLNFHVLNPLETYSEHVGHGQDPFGLNRRLLLAELAGIPLLLALQPLLVVEVVVLNHDGLQHVAELGELEIVGHRHHLVNV